jgi:hypothetical protein
MRLPTRQLFRLHVPGTKNGTKENGGPCGAAKFREETSKKADSTARGRIAARRKIGRSVVRVQSSFCGAALPLPQAGVARDRTPATAFGVAVRPPRSVNALCSLNQMRIRLKRRVIPKRRSNSNGRIDVFTDQQTEGMAQAGHRGYTRFHTLATCCLTDLHVCCQHSGGLRDVLRLPCIGDEVIDLPCLP